MPFRKDIQRRFRRLMMILLFATLIVPGSVATLSAGDAVAQTRGTFYGPYSDGCHYLWNGAVWTEGWCQQQGGSWDVYVPGVNGMWTWKWNYLEQADGVRVITDAVGVVWHYPDGSSLTVLSQDYQGLPAGTYFIYTSAGKLSEIGATDFVTYIPVLRANQTGELVWVSNQPAQPSTGGRQFELLEECYARNDVECIRTLEHVYEEQRKAAEIWLVPD